MRKDHDSGYKFLFSTPELVRDLIIGFVPDEWLASLDYSTRERVPGSVGQIVKPGRGQAIAPAVARYLPAALPPCGGGAGGEGEARSTSAITASRTAAVSVSMSLFQKRIIRNP
jgi:hypothetical protein